MDVVQDVYAELVTALREKLERRVIRIEGSRGMEAVTLVDPARPHGDVVQVWHPSLNQEGTEGPRAGWWIEWGQRGEGEAVVTMAADAAVWQVAHVAFALYLAL